MKTERFTCGNGDGMFENKKGYWVKYEDHLKMIEEYEAKLLLCNSSLQLPDELEPVLAKIEHINSLGKSTWYEVVFNDGNWRSYQGSKTFEDGEKVVDWNYCKAIV